MSLLEESAKIKRAVEGVSRQVSEEVSRSSLRAYKVVVTTAPYLGDDGKYYCGVKQIGDETEITVLCSPRMKNVAVDTINWVLVIFSNWRNAILWQSYDFYTDGGGDGTDTTVTFTEATTRTNISTGEKLSVLFGKIKKWFSDLKAHAFTAPSTSQNTSTTTVPSDKLLTESSFARVYRSVAEVSSSLTSTSTMIDLIGAMANNSILICQGSASIVGILPSGATNTGVLEVIRTANNNRVTATYTVKTTATETRQWFGEEQAIRGVKYFTWHEVVTIDTDQTISGEKTFTAGKTNANKYHITANDGNSANLYGDGLVLLATNGDNWGSGANGQYVFSSTEFRPSAYRQNLQDLGSSSSPWRTGYFGTQVRITSTADVGGTTDSTARAPLLIGTPTGTHLEFDSNEIIAKGSANTVGELFIQTDGGKTTIGNTLNWTELDTKRADLKVKGQIYDYGSNCSRGVDAGTNYAGYFKLAEAVIPSWYRGPKARIEILDGGSLQTATLVISGYIGSNGVSSSSQITLETSTVLRSWQNKFFLVVRQDKTVNNANKVFELWYYAPSGTTYNRVFASFRYDVADTRAGDPVVSKWNKFTRTSSVDQGYVSAGVVDLTNGFIPVGSFTASTFATTTYPDCEIYNDTMALQDRLSYLQIRNEESSYSDTPSTATTKVIDFIGKDFAKIAGINATVGASWNALNFDIKTKENVTHRIDFVSYPSTDNLHFSCQTDAKCNFGSPTRRWRNLYISGSLNDGTNAATATNIIKSVCVCETAAATAAKVVTIPNYTLRTGSMISIYFINTNTATQPTLNINNTGAIPIYFDNSRDTATTALTAGWHTFVYNGTNYYTGSLANSPWTQIKQNGQAFTTSLRLYAGTYEFMVIAPSYSVSGYAIQYGTMTIPGSGFNIAYDILSTGFYLYHSTAGAYDVYICRGTDGALVLQDKYGMNNNGQPVSVWYRQIQ